MADVTITAANVAASSNTSTETGVAGETITAGQVVYKDETTGKYMRTDANSATVAARVARGIALHGSLLNQPLTIATSGNVALSGVAAGVAYYVSPNPGGLAPVTDLLTGMQVCLVGISRSTTLLTLSITDSGVVL